MSTLASLTAIPFILVGASTTTPEVRLDSLQWGSPARYMESRFPGMIGSVSTSEAHDFANGFGIPQQKLSAKVFGLPGTAYVLYGRRSKLLVSVYWKPTDPTLCNPLAKFLRTALGKPTEIDRALATTTWENEAGDLDVSFVSRSSSCRLSILPSDPYAFD